MYPRPVEVKHLGAHRLEVTFEDGVRAELDFRPMAEWGGMFAALRDTDLFGRVQVDAESESLVWPNGVDICPDVLYHLATDAPLPGPLDRRAATLVRSSRVSQRVGA